MHEDFCFSNLYLDEDHCHLCGCDIEIEDYHYFDAIEEYTEAGGKGSCVVRSQWHIECFNEAHQKGWQ